MDIQVKYAESVDELHKIYRLRYEIYHQEMNLDSAAVDHKKKVLTDSNDDTARILYATADGEIVGTLRIHWGGDAPFPVEFNETYDVNRFESVVPPDQMVIFTRFMVRNQFRGTLLPFQLLGAIAQFSLEKKVRLSFCDCQPHLLNLYTRLGYRTYTKTYNDIMLGLLVPLVLVVEDLEHFQRINSPLLGFGGKDFNPPIPKEILALIPQAPSIQSVASEAAAEWARSYGLLSDSHERTSTIFDGLSEEDITKLMKRSFVIKCELNDLIIRKNSVDRTMFIILSGLVEVREGEQVVAVLSEGDVLGELAFLLHAERLSNVYAASDDVQILSLNEKAVLGLMENEPAIASRIFYNLAKVVGAKMVTFYEWTFTQT
jgi:predicted GNAT family N-acyltransferase